MVVTPKENHILTLYCSLVSTCSEVPAYVCASSIALASIATMRFSRAGIGTQCKWNSIPQAKKLFVMQASIK